MSAFEIAVLAGLAIIVFRGDGATGLGPLISKLGEIGTDLRDEIGQPHGVRGVLDRKLQEVADNLHDLSEKMEELGEKLDAIHGKLDEIIDRLDASKPDDLLEDFEEK